MSMTGLPSGELEEEVPISSGDDTRVVLRLMADKKVECRAQVTVSPKSPLPGIFG